MPSAPLTNCPSPLNGGLTKINLKLHTLKNGDNGSSSEDSSSLEIKTQDDINLSGTPGIKII